MFFSRPPPSPRRSHRLSGAAKCSRVRTGCCWRRTDLLSVLPHEINALFDFGQAALPVVLILDGDIALEVLLFEFVQDSFDIAGSLPIGHIVGRWTIVAFVLQMAADNPALKHSNTVDRIK